ncbi:MAG: dephospho-CoA kinase [Candidatus Symbiothrix sp.]|nr:dephospho-CoA kinase [Candidatus Symbiothrix sp.]
MLIQKQVDTELNPAQFHLLEMFSFMKQQESINELRAVLYDYYRQKVDAESAQLEEKYGMNEARIEEILNMHLRTPYK